MELKDLSINAQQTYKLALKMAEHKIDMAKLEANTKISHYNSLITFKNEVSEGKLYNARLSMLKENIEGLYANNEHDANLVVLANNMKMHKLNWSFVEIDRTNPNKEEIKKRIALYRYSSVIYEVNFEREKHLAKTIKNNFESYINYKLQRDDYCQEIYDNNLHLEKVSYHDFYQNTINEYEKITQNCKNVMESFMPLVQKVIEQSYTHTYAFELKETLRQQIKLINQYLSNILEAKTQIYNHEIDIEVYKEQLKEKLNVLDLKTKLEEQVKELHEEITKLEKQVQETHLHINEIIKEIDILKHKDFELEIKSEDELQNKVLEEIRCTFKFADNETFNSIYRIIKRYLLTLRPFYYDYFKNQSKQYILENLNYRREYAKNLDKKLVKIYLNDEDAYLRYITGLDGKNEEIVNALNEKHSKIIKEIQENHYKQSEIIKDEVLKMKKEYEESKKSAKRSMKIADAAKASEIREILKLSKKEIKVNKKSKYRVLSKEYKKLLNEEDKRYKLELINATNPKAVAIKHDYMQKRIHQNKFDEKQRKELYRITNKELKSSKYKKNLTTKTRENGLGYLFLSIWAIGFIIFTLLPIIYTLLMLPFNITWSSGGYSKIFEFSFQNGLSFPNYVGAGNFETLFLNNYVFSYQYVPRFFRSLLLYVPIVVFIGFVLAMLLNSKIRGRTIFRIIYFLPVVIVSGPILQMLNDKNTSGQSSIRLQLDGSSIAKILTSISPKVLEYANEVFSNFIIILWLTGVPIVLFISALQKINKQLYEAAEIDGANKWQTLWTVTFPLIKSVLLIVCLFTIMQVTTINVDFVNPINSWLGSKLSENNENFSVVALGAWVQTIIVLIFVLIAFLLFREKEFISKDKNYEEIEEIKRKKNQRRAKRREALHIDEINHFFDKVTAPLVKRINARKMKKKEKEEMEG